MFHGDRTEGGAGTLPADRRIGIKRGTASGERGAPYCEKGESRRLYELYRAERKRERGGSGEGDRCIWAYLPAGGRRVFAALQDAALRAGEGRF